MCVHECECEREFDGRGGGIYVIGMLYYFFILWLSVAPTVLIKMLIDCL